jgi:hypothetical protein
MSLAARVVGSILKHDKKVSSYKLALIRSINDVVLSYPDLADGGGTSLCQSDGCAVLASLLLSLRA